MDPNGTPKDPITTITGIYGGVSNPGTSNQTPNQMSPIMNQLSQTSNLLAGMLQPLATELADTAVYKLGGMPEAGDIPTAKLVGKALQYKSGMYINYAKAMMHKSTTGDQAATAALDGIFKELDSLNTKQDSFAIGLMKLTDGRTSNVERKNIIGGLRNYYGDYFSSQKAPVFAGALASLAQIGQLGTSIASAVDVLQRSGGVGASGGYGAGVTMQTDDPLEELLKKQGSVAEATNVYAQLLNNLKSAEVPEQYAKQDPNLIADLQYNTLKMIQNINANLGNPITGEAGNYTKDYTTNPYFTTKR